jgi:hypothetical protein
MHTDRARGLVRLRGGQVQSTTSADVNVARGTRCFHSECAVIVCRLMLIRRLRWHPTMPHTAVHTLVIGRRGLERPRLASHWLKSD